jgi:hypothetical protein
MALLVKLLKARGTLQAGSRQEAWKMLAVVVMIGVVLVSRLKTRKMLAESCESVKEMYCQYRRRSTSSCAHTAHHVVLTWRLG